MSHARNFMASLWWLRSILFLWVKTKVTSDPAQSLGLKPGVPVCYVLPSRSVTDLLVLDELCQRHGLPRPINKPKALKHQGTAAFVYLHKLGLIQVSRESDTKAPPPLTKLVAEAEADKTMEVQLVPVSIFWGRNPGKGERSLFKLLFFDDEHAGIVQKFFIVLAQGRSVFVNFGKPISLRNLADEAAGVEETAKKLRRVIRVHFRRQRTSALGPSLPDRATVVGHLMGTKAVKHAIQEEARKKQISVERAEAQARRYIMEIASETNASMVRFFDFFLSWLWNRMFDGVVIEHAQRLRELDQTAEIVYLPSHRSQLDYLLFSYSLYYSGFFPPHTAAGVNLNFWPAGPLLRRAGGFFLRRTFGGNRLYATVFNEYIHFLVTKGYSLKFYLEGGRSRTGRLLNPKTGMLAMVVHSYLRSRERPIILVPVYLGYDKVAEVRTYQRELRGEQKRKESVGQLLQARKVLKSKFGKAYIGFGEPIELAQYLDKARADWRDLEVDPEHKPGWMTPIVSTLAREVLTRVNSTAVVSPVALVALVLMASPQKAVSEDELLQLLGKLVEALQAAPYSRDVVLPIGSPADILKAAMTVAKIQRFAHPSGDVIYVDDREGVLLSYYRNNIMHLVAIPSLITSFFQHNDRMTMPELVSGCAALYPFLKAEFFLRWPAEDGPKVVGAVTDALVANGLLVREGDVLRRPDVTAKEFTSLKIMGRVLGQVLERYAVSTALLGRYAQTARGPLVRKDFETQCQLMAQRISILNGMNEPEFFDKNLFKNYIDLLKDLGLASEDEAGGLIIDARVGAVAAGATKLLSGDIRQSIARFSSSEPAVQ
jgi:glycerol-3-phosphate O-acyltransferase